MADSGSRGRWPFRLSMVALISFVAGPALATIRVIPPLAGFVLFALGGLLGLVAVVSGGVSALRGDAGSGLAGAVLGGLPAVFVILGAVRSGEFPRINDISTDLTDPPAFLQAKLFPANQGRDLSYPEGFKEIVRKGYPDLKPVQIQEPPAQILDRALLTARATPDWEITRVDREELTFEGVATSGLFKFQDDFVVRVRPEGAGSIVDMRSKSRDGKGDLGANAKRIRTFLAALAPR